MLNVTFFILGWLVFVYGQAANSVRSSSNGLTQDWAGMLKWLRLQHVMLIERAFFSAIFYAALNQLVIKTVEPALKASGLGMNVWGMSGLTGFSASSGIHQLMGVVGLRGTEVHEAVPPDASGTVQSGNPG